MATPAPPTPAYAQATAVDDEAEVRVTPGDAFVRAREIVHRGERLDMKALAAELGVARATLYRWTGERERLLSDIMWVDVCAVLDRLLESSSERGVARIQTIAERFLELLVSGEQFSTLLRAEGDTAFRLITAPNGGVRPRLVDKLAGHIREEVDAGFYRPPEDPELIAEGMVTLGERFLYNGGDLTANPDPDNARRVIALLIREV